ncbi:hypothetical protein K474DRAFT_1458367 [Panus rudis PR-1116 ss-1]|nr:hypothetical protein K474DRAFT_1458367 [Panus rudis PR-1116 ss-1]
MLMIPWNFTLTLLVLMSRVFFSTISSSTLQSNTSCTSMSPLCIGSLDMTPSFPLTPQEYPRFFRQRISHGTRELPGCVILMLSLTIYDPSEKLTFNTTFHSSQRADQAGLWGISFGNVHNFPTLVPMSDVYPAPVQPRNQINV